MSVEIHLLDNPGFPSDDYVVFVSEYQQGSYEGSGYAYALLSDGRIVEYCLSHCSCYGPLDNGHSMSWENFQDFVKDMESCRVHSGTFELVQAFVKAVTTQQG